MTAARLVGMHCESGDVLVNADDLPEARPIGDIIVIPTTGRLRLRMGNTYNGTFLGRRRFFAGKTATRASSYDERAIEELDARDVE